MIEVEGVKIWGCPWTPNLPQWAFYASEIAGEGHYSLIPTETDIIISHCPPYGYSDRVVGAGHVGSTPLLGAIMRVKPSLVICGHIHEGYGGYGIGQTTIHNVSHVDEFYDPVNPLVTIKDPEVCDFIPTLELPR